MTKEEDRLLADLYSDLKGAKKKRNNWIEIALKCQRLSDHYGSAKVTAEKLGVSYELVRSITSLLKLPEEIQNLVRNRRILYDAAKRLLTIDDSNKQIVVARAIADLPSHRQREIILYAKSVPDAKLEEYIQKVMRPKVTPDRIHIAVIPLNKDAFQSLHAFSKKRNISVEKLILGIINQWIEKGGP